MTQMYELWQTEWCPSSRRVRQRLTELAIDYISRQVPVEKNDRIRLRRRTGSESIPVLTVPDHAPVVGEEAILAYLDSHQPDPSQAHAHRLKAETARRRTLQEECKCPPQPATP
jgi:glutathione S-transferase